MSSIPYRAVAAVRNRMILVSLVSSGLVGLVSIYLGASPPLFAALIISALFSSIISFGIVKRLLSGIRSDQLQLLAQLAPELEHAEVQSQHDEIKSLLSTNNLIAEILDNKEKRRTELLAQIEAADETVTVAMKSRSTGDEKEASSVRDAVNSIELLTSSYSQVLAEIEALSERTDERASISTQMSATTDAIAENISRYSNSVFETSSAIEQMARATDETAENIRALSASTEQTVASISMISRSQCSVRDNSERSSVVSESVRIQAQQGLRSMGATMRAMQEIANSNDESFESINRLSSHSARVGEFLSVIQEVVEQTNLLSLNASIIAAQAGSRGRAFAVVAEEVRSLARRTSSSTSEIKELVRNIQKETASVQRSVTQGKDKVKQGVKISGMAHEALEAIFKSSEDAFNMVSSIAGETNEQAANITRISEEAEKNLERVQQITIATEQQKQGNKAIVKNLEQMRELAHRINSSAQEQAKGNRLYLKSVMDDNDRTRGLNNEAAHQINLASQAVEAIQVLEELVLANTLESRQVIESLSTVSDLVGAYRAEIVE